MSDFAQAFLLSFGSLWLLVPVIPVLGEVILGTRVWVSDFAQTLLLSFGSEFFGSCDSCIGEVMYVGV